MFRLYVSIVFGVVSVDPFYAVKYDSKNVIAPDILGCFLDSLSRSLSGASHQQCGIGLCLQCKDFSHGGRRRCIDENPLKGSRKTLHEVRGEGKLQEAAPLRWVPCGQKVKTQGIDAPDCQHRVILAFKTLR